MDDDSFDEVYDNSLDLLESMDSQQLQQELDDEGYVDSYDCDYATDSQHEQHNPED